MAYWIFKCNPEKYRLEDRLTDPNPTLSWTVSRFQRAIAKDDIVFLWVTGKQRGIRAVLRVDAPPQDMAELDHEQQYWAEPDTSIRCRVVGTIINRTVNLPAAELRETDGLENLSMFHGFQQASNFPVTDAEGVILMALVGSGGSV